MTVYQLNELHKWVTKSIDRFEYASSQALNDMLNSIKIVPGINRGGSRQDGTIPRDLGPLANSLESSVSGGPTAIGVDSYAIVLGNFGVGDVASFSWGGAIAPYVLAVHYGAKGVQGTYWRDRALSQFNDFYEAAIRRAKAQYP